MKKYPEMFDFETNLIKLDHRSVFVNRILKLIYEKNNGDIDKAIIEAEPFFIECEAIIRNIYELVENEIPLYGYYLLLKHGADNYFFSKKQYKKAIKKTVKACIIYYE